MANGKIEFHIQDADARVAYVSLPGHPGRGTPGAVANCVDLDALMKYSGPEIRFCFDKDSLLIGIEVVL